MPAKKTPSAKPSASARPTADKAPALQTTAHQAVVEWGFMPARARLIDVAAFFDRVERHGVADDFRCVALREASLALADGKPEHARRILEKLSDPTTEPDAVSTGKPAIGAYEAKRQAAGGKRSAASR